MSDIDNDDNRNDNNEDNQDNQDHVVDASEDDAGKIFVGALSWDTTATSLRHHFEKFGEVASVSIMSKQSGQPRGFAFVSMKDPAARDIVLAQDVHTIDGKVVDVKIAVPRSDVPVPTRTDSRKIFVGRLPAEVTEKDFSDYFSRFGPVKDVVIMVDHVSNRSRGFGFITFENDGCVDAALAQENEIMGKWVDVKRAEPRHMQMNDRGGRGGRGGRGYGGRGSYDSGGYGGYDMGGRGGYPQGRGGYGYGQMQGGRNMQGGSYGGPAYGAMGYGGGAYGAMGYGGAYGAVPQDSAGRGGMSGYGGAAGSAGYGGGSASYGGAAAYGGGSASYGYGDVGYGAQRGYGTQSAQGKADRSYRPY